ncbi:YwqI/YxiC family protein [Cytobacillus horneckiae]|uniref:Uncharacterized protein n=1 Tax=Cytobacillus horneckiae TaxID=549687 RepID=A0A2N0ZCF0_9BACI|nr:YwqI/YxiC family protein [Cytobacillus horneckiae]MEC1158126.1 YwqI/YxiC family protein [Cytobacillus horneckiae]MED2936397.1 YwqI/YxiC family protein [Cytobacillus horneckiae]PKG27169.1 hypothetical protein CWS20_20185 [Cytobacillus horneckiae]
MSEIKVVKSEVEAVFKELKSKIDPLDSSNPQICFSESKLDLTEQISNIEQNYYQVIEQYKSLLIKVEQDAWTSIEALFTADLDLARRSR